MNFPACFYGVSVLLKMITPWPPFPLSILAVVATLNSLNSRGIVLKCCCGP